MSKFCFVIMGFGEKTDYVTGRKFNLDNTYHNLIKPTVESAGYKCVRSDEVLTSGCIEKPMYSLLVYADLVIADISTLNPNALYELGVRHASRPFSTIIIAEDGLMGNNHPFDLNHLNTKFYHHLGDDIGVTERDRFSGELFNMIKSKEKQSVDSPLYSFIPHLENHTLIESEIEELFNIVLENESEQSKLLYQANNYMDNDDFSNAYLCWEKLNKLNSDEVYYIQQMALSKYKSSSPSVRDALENAKTIIENILQHNDPETMGIAGAINKNLFIETTDIYYLKQAKTFYTKGFILNSNYYNGENYATCLELLCGVTKDEEEKVHYKYQANEIRESLLKICIEQLEINLIDGVDDMWLFSTLANTYYYFDNIDQFNKFDDLFRKSASAQWMVSTYEKGIKLIKKYKGEK